MASISRSNMGTQIAQPGSTRRRVPWEDAHKKFARGVKEIYPKTEDLTRQKAAKLPRKGLKRGLR